MFGSLKPVLCRVCAEVKDVPCHRKKLYITILYNPCGRCGKINTVYIKVLEKNQIQKPYRANIPFSVPKVILREFGKNYSKLTETSRRSGDKHIYKSFQNGNYLGTLGTKAVDARLSKI